MTGKKHSDLTKAKMSLARRPFARALTVALNKKGPDGRKLLRYVADAIARDAMGGPGINPALTNVARREIADRLDGRPLDAEGGPAVAVQVIINSDDAKVL